MCPLVVLVAVLILFLFVSPHFLPLTTRGRSHVPEACDIFFSFQFFFLFLIWSENLLKSSSSFSPTSHADLISRNRSRGASKKSSSSSSFSTSVTNPNDYDVMVTDVIKAAGVETQRNRQQHRQQKDTSGVNIRKLRAIDLPSLPWSSSSWSLSSSSDPLYPFFNRKFFIFFSTVLSKLRQQWRCLADWSLWRHTQLSLFSFCFFVVTKINSNQSAIDTHQ